MAEKNKTEGTNAHVGRQAEEAESLGVLDPRNILINLWDRAKHDLTARELEWFAGLSELVELEAHNLSENLMAIGCLVGSDTNKTGSFKNPGETSTLLFSLSNQLSALSGMAHISGVAQDRLTHPELYARAECQNSDEAEETPKLTPDFSRCH